MTAAQRLQREKKEKYFKMWLDDEFKQTKYKTTKKFKEAMLMAYRKGVNSLG